MVASYPPKKIQVRPGIEGHAVKNWELPMKLKHKKTPFNTVHYDKTMV